jgi:hypothetical protein
MECFRVYRKNVPRETHDANQANPPDEPQFEGVVFSDGRVAIRWLTAARSVSVWDSLEDLKKIHGHPEYGSVWYWMDTISQNPVMIDTHAEEIEHGHARADALSQEHWKRV